MPSEKVLQVKQNYVAELAEKLKKSACGVLVDYSGITVADDTVLRKELREAGVDYFVVKNTLLKRAAEMAGVEGIDDVLEGTTALALAEEDIVTAPKILYKQEEANTACTAGIYASVPYPEARYRSKRNREEAVRISRIISARTKSAA